MSLAQIIVVVFPLLYLTYKKLGAVVLMLFATIFSVLFLTKPLFFLNEGCLAFFPAYIIVVCLGLICGDKNLLVKIKDFIIVKNEYIKLVATALRIDEKALRTEVSKIISSENIDFIENKGKIDKNTNRIVTKSLHACNS